MNAQLRRLLLPLLRAVKAGKPPSFRQRSAAEQAIFLLGKRFTKGKAPAAARKQAKQSKHREATAALREAVFQRAGGMCELGDAAAVKTRGSEMHHLEGGSGRRALQKLENCMYVCSRCHHDFHIRPEDFRTAVLTWCNNFRYPIPRRFRGEPKDLGLAKGAT